MIDITKLKLAEDCGRTVLKIIGADGLRELAKDGICPCYIVTNPLTKEQQYYFIPQEVNQWFSENYVEGIKSNFTPQIKFIDLNYPKPSTEVPIQLRCIKNLVELPEKYVRTPPGIYFLALKGEIVYIGQSVSVLSRLSGHILEGVKDFDSVFFLPCPINRLNDFEGAMIRRFMPKLNKVFPAKKLSEVQEFEMMQSVTM